MEWFYAENETRNGPVSESQLASLVASGKISRDTLVWNQSMTDWKPAGSTAFFPPGAQSPPEIPLPPGHHLCIVTGKHFPESQMLKTEHGWVSVEGKDTYYQSLREGAPLPMAGGTNATTDGKYVIVPAQGSRLPLRCVKTNQPVTENEMKRQTLFWCPPLVFLSILVNLIILLVLYFVFRKKVVVEIPLSPAGKKIVSQKRLIAWAAGIAGVVLAIAGGASIEAISGAVFLMILGILLFLGAIIYGARKGSLLRVAKLKNGEAWLLGAGKEFINSLPRRGL
jgi:hypothetical protein